MLTALAEAGVRFVLLIGRMAAGLHVFVASLKGVIRTKEAAGRDKDPVAVPRLRRLLDRVRREE